MLEDEVDSFERLGTRGRRKALGTRHKALVECECRLKLFRLKAEGNTEYRIQKAEGRMNYIGPSAPIPNDPANKVKTLHRRKGQVFLRPGLPDSGKTMKVNIQNATTQMLRRSHLLGRSTVEQTFLSVMGAVPKSWLAKPHRIPAPQVPRSTELQFRPPLQRQPGNSLPGGDENRRPSRLRCPGAEAPDNGRS